MKKSDDLGTKYKLKINCMTTTAAYVLWSRTSKLSAMLHQLQAEVKIRADDNGILSKHDAEVMADKYDKLMSSYLRFLDDEVIE